MGTPPKSASVRVVGRRQFAEADLDDPDTPYAVGPDGEICVEHTTEISTEDAIATAAAVARRRLDAETLVDNLSPSAYAVHLAMLAALRPHAAAIESRLAGDPPHLLFAVRLANDDWYIPASRAFEAVVGGTVADRLRVPTKTTSAAPEREHFNHVSGYQLSAHSILRAVKSDHVLAVYNREDHLPAELRPFCDVVLDFNPIAPRHFELAIQREFEAQSSLGWTPWICQADLDPVLLDSVCSRVGRVEDVVPMLRSILDARAAAKKKEADATAAAPASTSKASKGTYAPAVTTPTTPTLADLSGYGAAKAWGEQLAEDVRDYKAGHLAWADVDGGCMLHGPPGTGKTLFASALAATTCLPFIAASYAQWQSSGDGHLGYVTKAIRATFAAAAENAPCILFIDEIDAIPGRGGRGESDGWWSAIVAALLECLDGTSRREGVVVIAACNHPEVLDPAMVRSGRLDRRFEIGLPDEPALLGIMRHHLPDASAAELAPAATALAGMTSGADVARIARDARRVARRGKRSVTAADLLSIAIPRDDLSEVDRRLVAIHEAGHAVAIMHSGSIPDMLSIVTVAGTHGGVRAGSTIGMGRLAEFEAEVVGRLAGRAAEEVILGEPSAGAEGDLQAATAVVTQMLGRAGLGGRLVHSEAVDGHAVEGRLRDLYGRALRLVGEHRSAVEKLADLAIERRVLGRAALVEFAREHGFGGQV